ncbi:hypothetical protein ACQKH5_02975 [Hyphomonas sp. NPDC076900]|uniref:hypothetical protein n=1 Tax=unclassified Hyphomonas TaxID=2630699 RepID=UPI003D08BEB4
MTEAGLTFATATVIALAGVVSGALLKGAWQRRSPQRPWLILAGWALLAASILGPAFWLGSARGVFIALAMAPLGAFAIVLLNLERRQSRARKARDAALEPSDRPSSAWRGWLRVLLAGPLGMAAALGVAIAYTVWVPGVPQTRLITGGLLVPVLWGAAMAWTLSDDRILRAAALLAGVTVTTFTAAFLKGFT